MSAWIHVSLSQTASVLLHPSTNSTAESFLGTLSPTYSPCHHWAQCLRRELDIDTADDKEDDCCADEMVWTMLRENREKKG